MATPVIMPRQGNSVESCIITKWLVKVGDNVKVGDVLFSYETDKSSFEEESKFTGQVLDIFFGEGDDVPCLTNVCVIGEPGESAAQFDPRTAEAAPEATAAPEAETAAAPAAATTEAPAAAAAPAAQPGQLPERISPRARKLADERHADLTFAAATGPDGRVIARDVEALIAQGHVFTPGAANAGYAGGLTGTGIGGRVTAADVAAAAAAPRAEAPAAETVAAPAAAPAAPEYVDEPMPNIRKVIARQMTLSLSSMAQLTHNISFDCTELQAMRKLFKEQGAPLGMEKITLNDMMLFAVSRVLARPEHRALNANLLDGTTMRYFANVQLGCAVDTPRGLMVPTIRDANKKSLLEISREAKALAAACQSGTIDPDLLKGGSFTVSNLGSLGIESFTPVINPPQTGILGVNTIVTRVREVNGQIVPYSTMTLSLTYDHRALDGAPASRFLKDLKDALEHFTLTLAAG